MDASADLNHRPDRTAAPDLPRPSPARAVPAGEPGTPHLALDGFDGPLDRLLTLARAQQVDIGEISLTALVEQLAAALRHAPPTMPLGQKADWVVMTAWLLQLRSRLLLPADAAAQQEAAAEAGRLQERLVGLRQVQALANWLERQPQLGHEVFGRGRPEAVGVLAEPRPELDVIEFLWASLALFDDEPIPNTMSVYRLAQHLALYAVTDARDRILRRLADTPGGAPLELLLPEAPVQPEREPLHTIRRRSAWSTTFAASLELAKQGVVALTQDGGFQPIHAVRV